MIKRGIITLITSVCIEAGSECQLVDRMQLFHQRNPARLPLVHYSATLVGWNQYFRRAECTVHTHAWRLPLCPAWWFGIEEVGVLSGLHQVIGLALPSHTQPILS